MNIRQKQSLQYKANQHSFDSESLQRQIRLTCCSVLLGTHTCKVKSGCVSLKKWPGGEGEEGGA